MGDLQLATTPGGRDDEIPFPPEEIERLETRKWILHHVQAGGVGAEIGVFRGHFSAVLAELLRPKTLYLVDPWTKLGESFGWGEQSLYTGFGRLTTKYAYEDAKRRVEKFKNIDIRFVEASAHEFLPSVGEQLDWVYLDASHAYASTLNELKLIDKVLKPDGVIIGDDWQPSPTHKHHGVFRAVNEFVRSNPYEFVAAGPAAQWCIRRTGERHKVKVVLEGHKWILHSTVDSLYDTVPVDEPCDICGVVVLSHAAAPDCELWLADGNIERRVDWAERSPFMAKAYPNGRNSEHARFRITGVTLQKGRAIKLFLKSAAGECVNVGEILVD